MRLRNLDERRAALSRASSFRRAIKPETRFALKRLDKHKRGPLKRAMEKQEEARRVKKECTYIR